MAGHADRLEGRADRVERAAQKANSRAEIELRARMTAAQWELEDRFRPFVASARERERANAEAPRVAPGRQH
ncbi:hypothetical protein [Streptacidiphilus sp. MAP12-16]|uniref:hypothetical protein n=1 Tax=Streptacidiphilus sp. MAP12-16 TaxID=3156300 RepID=UPI003515397C